MIQLAHPLSLLALLAIPVLLALYLLRPRPRRLVVSTVSLWQAALRDREGAHGYRRLLRNLSLLLVLAAAAALAFGLAAPQWLAQADERADTVLVLDASASMKTRSGLSSTRFDLALAEAGAIVDRMPRGGRMLVMTSARRAVLRSGFESDRAALRRVLRTLTPTDEAGRPREALALALSLLQVRPQGRVYFVTDGAFDPEADPRSPQVVFRVVGEAARNVAITRFDFRQEQAGTERFQVLMTVRNYADAPAAVPASASLDGQPLFERKLELAPGSEQTLVLGFPGRALGAAHARIDIDDDLAADNRAYAAANALPVLHVLLLTPGNFYLESVLGALPDVALSVRAWSPGDDLAALARGHDVVVLDRTADLPPLPPGNFVLVDAVAPGLPFREAGRVTEPRITGTGSSALMRHIDLGAVRVHEAARVVVEEPAPGLQRLFWSPQTDLALALIDEQRKVVYLGFDLARSDFPLQAAFPLFMSQSLEWLRPRGTVSTSQQVAAGATYRIHAPAGRTQVEVRTPSGSIVPVSLTDGRGSFDATSTAGIYGYDLGEGPRHFAVNLADPAESDVNRRWTPGEQPATAEAPSSPAQGFLPLWPYLVMLVLALLMAEWWLWAGSRSRA